MKLYICIYVYLYKILSYLNIYFSIIFLCKKNKSEPLKATIANDVTSINKNYSNNSKPPIYTNRIQGETGHEMDYRIHRPLYPDNERRSRVTRVKPIKRFFRTYLPRVEREEGFPLYRDTAFERVFRDTGGYICIC